MKATPLAGSTIWLACLAFGLAAGAALAEEGPPKDAKGRARSP